MEIKDYNEILLKSIDTIVMSRIADVNFDRTIQCTIIDASEAERGKYTLSDGSIEFTASSENTKYQKDDRVNVLIPSNDFSKEKTILGKCSANENEKPITYVAPSDKVVIVSENYAKLEDSYASIKANGGTTTKNENTGEITFTPIIEKLLWSTKVTEPTINFNTLCVSAEFKTLMNDYEMRDGNYGIRIDLTSNKANKFHILLDNKKDMFGNPYAYVVYLKQEQTYHLSMEENIVQIDGYLYQLDNFVFDDGVSKDYIKLGSENDENAYDYDDIYVKNISVAFGYNAEQVADNTVVINTASVKTYNNITNENLEKTMSLVWYNKDESNKYIGFTDGEFGTLEEAKTRDSKKYYIQWEHNQNNGEWTPIGQTGKETNLTVSVNTKWQTNEYQAKVYFDGNVYSSNILSFKAATGYDSNIHDQLNMSLELKHYSNNSLDSYPFYGEDSAIINVGDENAIRELQYTYNSSVGGTLEPEVLNGASAYFYIPTVSTMLNQPYNNPWLLTDEEAKKDKIYLEGYKVYKKSYIDEFTRYDDATLNILKNTAPAELNGHGKGYNYEKQINYWVSADKESYEVQARSGGTSGVKALKLQALQGKTPSSAVAKQQVYLKKSTDYTLFSYAYPNSLNSATARIYIEYIPVNDPSKITSHMIGPEISCKKFSWNLLSGTFTTPDNLSDYNVFICLESNDVSYTLWKETMLYEGTSDELKPWAPAEKEASQAAEKAKVFSYCVQGYYNSQFNNNTILLKIIDKNGYEYSTKKEFAFSSYGTCGTDYTLVIENTSADSPKATLYDVDQKPIGGADSWSYWPNTQMQTASPVDGYAVRRAVAKVDWVSGPVSLEALKAIPWQKSEEYYYQGPTTIIYDSRGTNPKYYSGDIGLFRKDNNEPIDVELTWVLQYYSYSDTMRETVSDNKAKTYYPQLTITDSSEMPRLKAPTIYLSNSAYEKYYLVLVAQGENNTPYWRQPLIILQNSYASALLNNWDGSLQINEGDNYILSAMMAAGTKTGNTFTGVVMGDIGPLQSDYSAQTHGLLGFHEGAQSFGFETNGKAFIGKSGKGRIEFDGNYGVIKSSTWDGTINSDTGNIQTTGTEGMAIALQSGQIDAHDFKLTSGNIYLNSNPGAKDYYFKIGNQDNTYIWYDKNGTLEAKIGKLELTSSLGGANLLQMTAPTADELTAKKDSLPWAYSTGASITAVKHKSSDTEHTLCVSLDDGDANYETLEQTVRVEQGKYYTLSGYLVNRKTDRAYSLAAYVNDNEVFRKNNVPAEGRVYFSHTFYNDSLDQIKIGFKSLSKRTFGIYHAQLEEGTVATAWKSAEHDTKVSIAVTADGITQTVSGAMAADFYAETHSDGTTSATTTTKKVKITSPTSFSYDNIFKDGVVLAVRCKYANTKNDGVIKLNIANTSIDPDAGYPIYYNGKITSKDNPFIWDQGAVIYLRYSTITNPPHWDVISGSGVNQLLVNTQGITGTAIERTGTGFKFNLDSSSFRVGPTNGNAVLKVDGDGLYIDGNGTFKGILEASKIIIQDGADLGGLVTTGTLNAWEISANKISAGSLGTDITIGGWKIGANSFYCDAYNGFVGLYSNYPTSIAISGSEKRDDWRIVAGTSGNETFGVTKSGELFCKNATLTGTLESKPDKNYACVSKVEPGAFSIYHSTTKEHLFFVASDLLPDPTPESRLANKVGVIIGDTSDNSEHTSFSLSVGAEQFGGYNTVYYYDKYTNSHTFYGDLYTGTSKGATTTISYNKQTLHFTNGLLTSVTSSM